jgi:hypothetical protein
VAVEEEQVDAQRVVYKHPLDWYYQRPDFLRIQSYILIQFFSFTKNAGETMTRITVRRTINAPIEFIFDTVSNINNYSKAVSDIINIEFLSDVTLGIGARFRETRLRRGKEVSTELEVTEFVENNLIRMVADSHGTVWDSVFTLIAEDNQTVLSLTMDAKAYKFLPKLMNPPLKSIIQKGVEKDMDAVKIYCEKNSSFNKTVN